MVGTGYGGWGGNHDDPISGARLPAANFKNCEVMMPSAGLNPIGPSFKEDDSRFCKAVKGSLSRQMAPQHNLGDS
eukprot:133485-Hanusia_phi.AAC.2